MRARIGDAESDLFKIDASAIFVNWAFLALDQQRVPIAH